ncbi:MAG: NAD(P)/FAD-dependent oxidoreductase [Jatrophihabitantaceae bacterium]
MSRSYRGLSLWFDTLPTSLAPRTPLPGPAEVDVAIVGGGFTGLWTAYYLLAAEPSLRVAVLESEIAGFGASGRNGGWCSTLYPVGLATLAAESGRDAAIAQYRAMRGAVDEVVRVAAAEGIDADVAVGGTVVLARTSTQLARARAEVAEAADFGFDLALLDAEAARARLAATNVLGATFTPHCAAIQPAKLVRGLAEVIEARGACIHEQTPVTGIEPGVVHTKHGDVQARTIVRATEGYTARLPGSRRALAPVYSLIIATEPLPDSVWDEIGLRQRETFSDFRHLIVYGQRTADGRMVFGGRGAPYHLGSRIKASYDQVPRVFYALQRTLVELFPVLRDVPITYRWGGPLGIARDWHASVGLDRETGLAWAGGYVGDGVSTTNLAGRTLADLIIGRSSELTALPWVGHRSRSWEPEPLRWLGANAGLQAMTWADRAEARTGKSSRLAGLVNAMMGR